MVSGAGAALLVQPPDRLRLLKEGAALEEGRSLADQAVESGDSLAMIYQQEGAFSTAAAALGPRLENSFIACTSCGV